MAGDKVELRASPDTTAPSTPKTRTQRFLASTSSLVGFFSLLPWTLFTTSIKHALGVYPAWQTWKVSLTTQSIKLYLWAFCVIHLPLPNPSQWDVPKPALPSAKKAREGINVERVILPPVSSEMRKAVADVPAIKAVERPAWMMEKEAAAASRKELLRNAEEGEKVVMYCHSGAYVIGHPLENGFAWNMARDLNLRLFAFNYRKTLDAENAHPAPLLDALAAYLYLVHTLKFAPENIIVVGDSAGGHLALWLSRYLDLLDMPLPGSLALSSPWCDFTASSTRSNFPSQKDNYETDYLPFLGDKAIESGMRYYTLGTRRTAWFSPAFASADEWAYLKRRGVKVYLMRGTKELLCDEVGAVAKSMELAGVDVVLRDDIDGLHVGPTMRWGGSPSWKVWIDDLKQFVHAGKVDL